MFCQVSLVAILEKRPINVVTDVEFLSAVGKIRSITIITEYPQYAERILNKIAKAINETFAGLKLMLQGFRIYFFRNPSIKGMESTS